ncbi:hypothetical protein CAL20_15370 [Bordetella genomosp. 4]|uniref:Uncharacterized protein n=2 Tax=Bordetella genomosp. 4 TaxID=463044 RepID=A0A261U520_9BORD|nr:hypothetical protein CAL20_15370 [Bordetella genomosp. 4]
MDDGGPAFPWGEYGSHLGGMSLRDYFAAKAMQGLVTAEDPWRGYDYKPVNGLTIPENDARLAYRIADAMLKARQENSNE